MWVMYPATVTVSSPRSRNHSSRSVPVKLPGRFFSIQWSRGRDATSGCSSHPGVPRLKKGISGCVKVCWTTTTGRPAVGRGVHHAQDVVEVGVRVGDRQLAPREVFVLDVDDQQGSLHDDSRSSVMACRQVEAGFAPHEHGEAAGRFIRPRIGDLRRRSDRIPDGFTRRGRSCPDQRFGAGKRQGPGPPGLPHRRSSAGPEPSRPRPPSTVQPWRGNSARRLIRPGRMIRSVR